MQDGNKMFSTHKCGETYHYTLLSVLVVDVTIA